MKKIKYDYKPTLKAPLKYQYTEFMGPEFIEAYKSERSKIKFNVSRILKYKKIGLKKLNLLVKEYEVKKRIEELKHLDEYVIFSMNLAIACRDTSNLKFLNTLLKLNDMLCAMEKEISKDYKSFLYLSIGIELREIDKLWKK